MTALCCFSGCTLYALRKAFDAAVDAAEKVAEEFEKDNADDEKTEGYIRKQNGFQFFKNGYAYIVALPKGEEEVTIPEYFAVNGGIVKVKGFGGVYQGFMWLSDKYTVDFSGVKKLNFTSFLYKENVANTGDIMITTYTDFIYAYYAAKNGENMEKLFIPKWGGEGSEVWLLNGERDVERFDIEGITIYIRSFVTVIEKGVFDYLTDCVIKTEHKEKPEGFEEGWEGSCTVEWGSEF